MLSLHTNAAALSTQNALGANNKSLTSSMTKLGTGFRINSAMDDAAGLQIANRLKAQNSGMAVAMRNTQNGISLMQTAEGALNEVNTMLVRMKDLATQSADASASVADKEAMQAEYDSLVAEITNIVGNTTFGGEKLMNKKAVAADVTTAQAKVTDLTAAFGATVTDGLQATLAADKADYDTKKVAYETALAGTDDAAKKTTAAAMYTALDKLTATQKQHDEAKVSLDEATALHTALAASVADANSKSGKFASSLQFQIGSSTSESMTLDIQAAFNAMHSGLSGISTKYTSFGVTVPGQGQELTVNASAVIDKLQNVLDSVGEVRSALGAASNRLEHTNSNLANMSSTTSAAIGRIMDVDYASETSNMTKNQMLMQASSAMLKQSNSMSQMVASLLQ